MFVDGSEGVKLFFISYLAFQWFQAYNEEKKLSISLEAGGSPAQVRYCESQIQKMLGEGGLSAATGFVHSSRQSA